MYRRNDVENIREFISAFCNAYFPWSNPNAPETLYLVFMTIDLAMKQSGVVQIPYDMKLGEIMIDSNRDLILDYYTIDETYSMREVIPQAKAWEIFSSTGGTR